MELVLKHKISNSLAEYLKHEGLTIQQFATKEKSHLAYLKKILQKEFSFKRNGKTLNVSDDFFRRLAVKIGFNANKIQWEFRQTAQALQILSILEDAKKHSSTCVIIGETGCGKTYVSDLFARQHTTSCFKVLVGMSDNHNDILDKCSTAIKLAKGVRFNNTLSKIVDHLKLLSFDGSKPMLIFDESEYMQHRTLCAMKQLYDELHGFCSIVMIGTDQFTANLEKLRKRNMPGMPQFYRRIKFGIRQLPGINRSFSEFVNKIEDKQLIRFLQRNCDNYGELHDVLVPAMREAKRVGVPLTETFVRTVFNLPAGDFNL